MSTFELRVEYDREEDGRWIAEAVDLPGVMVYGDSKPEATHKVKLLALEVVREMVESSNPEDATSPVTILDVAIADTLRREA